MDALHPGVILAKIASTFSMASAVTCSGRTSLFADLVKLRTARIEAENRMAYLRGSSMESSVLGQTSRLGERNLSTVL